MAISVVFLLTHIPNPRMNKRMALLRKSSEVSVVCVRRARENIWEPALHDVQHHVFSVDYPSSRQTFKRFVASVRFAGYALGKLWHQKPTLIYAESLDSLLIARLYQFVHQKTRLVFEVADVRESLLEKQDGLKDRLLSFIERRLYPHVSLLVLTSDRFYHQYYQQFFPREKVTIMLNIPDLTAFQHYQRKQGGPFTVGFIGGIRYLEQMKMLVDAAEHAGVRVLFAGAGGTTEDAEGIMAYCEGKRHVSFTGKYQYDRDIAKLYGKVDCVYAVYDADNPNVRIALPNKLYEAAHCGLPIVVAKGTYLSELVDKHGLGYSVSHKDMIELLHLMEQLKISYVAKRDRFVRAGKVFLMATPLPKLADRLQELATEQI